MGAFFFYFTFARTVHARMFIQFAPLEGGGLLALLWLHWVPCTQSATNVGSRSTPHTVHGTVLRTKYGHTRVSGTHNAATLREANHRTEKRHPTVRCSDGGNLAKQQQQQSRHPYTVSHTQPRAYHDETCESERPKRRERERDKASTAP